MKAIFVFFFSILIRKKGCCLNKEKPHNETFDLKTNKLDNSKPQIKEASKNKVSPSALSDLQSEVSFTQTKDKLVINHYDYEINNLNMTGKNIKIVSVGSQDYSSNGALSVSGTSNNQHLNMQQSSTVVDDESPPCETDFLTQVISPEINKHGNRLLLRVF